MNRGRALFGAALLLLAVGNSEVPVSVEAADLPTVAHEGRTYVEISRIAAKLGTKLDATAQSIRANIRTSDHRVTFTRNWSQIVVDGKIFVLEAPVRVRRGTWLVPQSFIVRVLPGLTRRRAVASAPAPPADPAPAAAVVAPPSPAVVTAAPTRPAAPPPSATDPAEQAHRPAATAPVAAVATARPAPPPPAAAAPPASRPATAAATPPAPTASPAMLPPALKPATSALVMTSPAPAPPAVSSRTTPSATGAALDEMRLRSYPSFTRVVLETSSPLTYAIEARGPAMARVKLPALATESRHEQVRDGYVDEVRLDRVGADAVLRVTFEGEAGDIRVGALSDPPRLVLDFIRPGQQETSRRPEGIGPLKTIVLDAGHGGHDSGAVGPTGLMEKEVVLDITRRVAKLIEQRLDMKVLLSRGTDTFVTLKDRTSFANKERADLFVSIHANAHREAASEGVETYFLSSEATDSAARQVAALENGVVQLEKPGPRGRDIVKSILWDLAQSEFQEDSSHLAEVVLDSMTQTLRIPNRGVKQAGFYVLGGAAMPAVLIEIGFVTNPREEKKLRDSKYRDEIAKAIFEGIAEYKVRWTQRSKTALDGSR